MFGCDGASLTNDLSPWMAFDFCLFHKKKHVFLLVNKCLSLGWTCRNLWHNNKVKWFCTCHRGLRHQRYLWSSRVLLCVVHFTRDSDAGHQVRDARLLHVRKMMHGQERASICEWPGDINNHSSTSSSSSSSSPDLESQLCSEFSYRCWTWGRPTHQDSGCGCHVRSVFSPVRPPPRSRSPPRSLPLDWPSWRRSTAPPGVRNTFGPESSQNLFNIYLRSDEPTNQNQITWLWVGQL